MYSTSGERVNRMVGPLFFYLVRWLYNSGTTVFLPLTSVFYFGEGVRGGGGC
jgi:hypothetical protein